MKNKTSGNQKVKQGKNSNSIKATIGKILVKNDNKEVKFKFRITNTGKAVFDKDTKLKLTILRVKGQKICQDCNGMQVVSEYTEAKVFNKCLDGLKLKKSEEVEFVFEPEIFGTYEYFAEILHGNETISRTKNQNFYHNKMR